MWRNILGNSWNKDFVGKHLHIMSSVLFLNNGCMPRQQLSGFLWTPKEDTPTVSCEVYVAHTYTYIVSCEEVYVAHSAQTSICWALRYTVTKSRLEYPWGKEINRYALNIRPYQNRSQQKGVIPLHWPDPHATSIFSTTSFVDLKFSSSVSIYFPEQKNGNLNIKMVSLVKRQRKMCNCQEEGRWKVDSPGP